MCPPKIDKCQLIWNEESGKSEKIFFWSHSPIYFVLWYINIFLYNLDTLSGRLFVVFDVFIFFYNYYCHRSACWVEDSAFEELKIFYSALVDSRLQLLLLEENYCHHQKNKFIKKDFSSILLSGFKANDVNGKWLHRDFFQQRKFFVSFSFNEFAEIFHNLLIQAQLDSYFRFRVGAGKYKM